MTTVRVEVTADDIARGLRRSSCNCPVALAVGRKTAADAVSVSSVEIAAFWGAGRHWWARPTPVPATLFIGRFDAREPVEPFAFDLDVPS